MRRHFQLYINDNLITELFSERSSISKYEVVKRFKSKYWYAIARNDWYVIEVKQSKMNKIDFRLKEDEYSSWVGYKKAS